MAPTQSSVLVLPSNHPSSRHLHHARRQMLPSSRSTSHIKQLKPRAPDTTSQPSVIPEGPPLPPMVPTPSESVTPGPRPSAIPFKNSQPFGLSPSGDMSGNLVAAVIVIVLILGGLVGLVIGGEILRRRARTPEGNVSPLRSRCFGRRRKSEPTKNATGSPQLHTNASNEGFPCDDKILSPLTRPPPTLNRGRQRRLFDVWPICTLSRALCNRQSPQMQVDSSIEDSPPAASPQTSSQTTWSDFSPVSLYVPSPRTVLSRIPEEPEDCESQTDFAVMLGVTLQRSSEPDAKAPNTQMHRPKPPHIVLLEGSDGPEASETTARRVSGDCETIPKTGTGEDDTRSLGSLAPDMMSDEAESSRSSTASLESLEGGNDGESLREEVFELRRAQTRSMQMNKGVLLSLSLKTLDDSQNVEPGQSLSKPNAGSDRDREKNLAMLGGSFSAVSLDEFPSSPSILPMIPSLVSGF